MNKFWLPAALLAAASACSSPHTAAKPQAKASMSPAASASPAAYAAPNCSKNATLYCGFQTKAEWLSKYQNGDGQHSAQQLQKEYNAFGVFPQRMQKAVPGVMAPSNNGTSKWQVTTAGGQTIDISKAYVGAPDTGHTLVIGNLSMVPVASSYSYAVKVMVYLLNGQFQWALVLSDGNPVVLPQAARD